MQASDARRNRIAHVKPNMTAALREKNLRKAADIVEESLELLKVEGLEAGSTELHQLLAMIYKGMDEDVLAYEHAEQAVALKVFFDFLEPRNRTGDLEALLANLS